MENIGIQLFSLPSILDQDFEKGLKLLQDLGYKNLEFYGPYDFSAREAIQNWEAVVPALGFSGSGFFGHSATTVRRLLDEHELKASATHVDLATLENKMGKLGEAAEIVGFEYVGIAMIPEEKRKNLDDYKRMAESFNRIGKEAKEKGLKFSYHNHGYGLTELDGEIPLFTILENTDPDLVFLEMDIFWTTAGGKNPLDLLEKYGDRYRLMHLKDMKERRSFSGDGANAEQWMELYPLMTTIGDGILEIRSIVEKAKDLGIDKLFVEQDMVSDPEIALKRSIDFLKNL